MLRFYVIVTYVYLAFMLFVRHHYDIILQSMVSIVNMIHIQSQNKNQKINIHIVHITPSPSPP